MNLSFSTFSGGAPHLTTTLGPVPNDFVDYLSLLYLNVSYENSRGYVPFFQEHNGVNKNLKQGSRLIVVDTIAVVQEIDPSNAGRKLKISSERVE